MNQAALQIVAGGKLYLAVTAKVHVIPIPTIRSVWRVYAASLVGSPATDRWSPPHGRWSNYVLVTGQVAESEAVSRLSEGRLG